MPASSGTGAAHFSGVAANGALVYVNTSVKSPSRTVVWVDRSGREEPLTADAPQAYSYPRLSPDGTRLAVAARHAWC